MSRNATRTRWQGIRLQFTSRQCGNSRSDLIASRTRSSPGEVDAVSLTNDSGSASDYDAVVRLVDAPTGADTIDMKVKPSMAHDKHRQ